MIWACWRPNNSRQLARMVPQPIKPPLATSPMQPGSLTVCEGQVSAGQDVRCPSNAACEEAGEFDVLFRQLQSQEFLRGNAQLVQTPTVQNWRCHCQHVFCIDLIDLIFDSARSPVALMSLSLAHARLVDGRKRQKKTGRHP